MFRAEVKVQRDEALRGTPFRQCLIRVAGKKADRELLDRIRVALAPVLRNAEVNVVDTGDGGNGLALAATYYGRQATAESIEQAVRGAI